MVAKGGQSGNVFSHHSELRLYKKTLAIDRKLHPGMSDAIAAVLSEHHARVVSQIEQLAPRPQSKVVTIAFSDLFKMLWRLPIVLSAELFFVSDSLAVP